MKKSMFKGMAAILAFAIVLSLMPAAFAEGAVEIVSVFSQSGQDISKPIKVLALIPEGAENVTLSLGDTALTTAVTNSELYGEGYSVVSGTIPANPTLGDNTLTLSADVGGANVSDESTITLRKYVFSENVRSTDFTGMSEKTDAEAKALGAIGVYPIYPFIPVVKDAESGNEYYKITNIDGKDGNDGLSLYSNSSLSWRRYPYLNAGDTKEKLPLNDALIKISFDISVNKIGPAVDFRADQYELESFHFWSAKGHDYWFKLPLITSEGTICDSSVTVTPGESYTFTVILNRTTLKYDIYVNDETVSGGRFDYFYASNTAPCLHRITFITDVDGANEEAVIFDNISIDLYKEFPVSRGLSYTENEVLTEAAENKVPISASSITAKLYGATAENLTNLEGNVYIEKPDGGMISCTASIKDTASGKDAELTVTPSEALDAGVNYKIIMNENVKYANNAYGSKTAIPFSTFAKFNVTSPADNAVVNIDEPLSVSATAPVGTTVKFLVDGVLKGSIQSLTGYVNVAIPTAGLTEGRKSLDVVVVSADGTTQTISRNISLRGFVKRHYMQMTNFELVGGQYRSEVNTYNLNWSLQSHLENTNYISARSTEVIDRAADDKAFMVKVTPLNSSQTFPMPASSTGMVNIWLYNGDADGAPDRKVSRVGQTAVFEFDVMFPDVLDYGLCVSPSNYRADTIFKDGKLPDGTAIEAGRWYSIKIVDDFTACTTTSDKCKRSIYIDGKFAKSGTPSESAEKASGYEYVRIALIKNSNWTEEQVAAGERSAFAVDNVNLYTLVSIPTATDISYTKNDASVKVSKVVPCDASSISVTFDRAFDETTMTAENVKLIVNGEDTNSAVAYDAVNNKLTVTPPADTLTKYADAKITLGSNIKIKTLIATQALGKEVAIDLKIGDTENCFYAVTLSKTETDVIGKYEIINESGTAKTMNLFMPTYNTSESKLLSVDHEEFTLEPGKAIIKTLTNPLANADIAKALVWDEFLSPIVTIPAYSLK